MAREPRSAHHRREDTRSRTTQSQGFRQAPYDNLEFIHFGGLPAIHVTSSGTERMHQPGSMIPDARSLATIMAETSQERSEHAYRRAGLWIRSPIYPNQLRQPAQALPYAIYVPSSTPRDIAVRHIRTLINTPRCGFNYIPRKIRESHDEAHGGALSEAHGNWNGRLTLLRS